MPFNKEEIFKEIKNFNNDESINVEIEQIKGEICLIILPDTFSRKSFEPFLAKFFCNIK